MCLRFFVSFIGKSIVNLLLMSMASYFFVTATSHSFHDEDIRLLSRLPTREHIAEICDHLKFKIGVELGVKTGDFAFNNLESWKACDKYYLIDIWGHQPNYADSANLNNIGQEWAYEVAKKKLAQFGEKAQFIRNLTSVASSFFANASIDFIYIDARHDYCGCKSDIEMWWPKLRKGGIMAGHDYITAYKHKQFKPRDDWSICADGTKNSGAVKYAVVEFAAKNGLRVFTTVDDTPWISWIFSRKD